MRVRSAMQQQQHSIAATTEGSEEETCTSQPYLARDSHAYLSADLPPHPSAPNPVGNMAASFMSLGANLGLTSSVGTHHAENARGSDDVYPGTRNSAHWWVNQSFPMIRASPPPMSTYCLAPSPPIRRRRNKHWWAKSYRNCYGYVISRYEYGRTRRTYHYLDENKWQKFKISPTWEEQCDLEFQTCQAFSSGVHPAELSFECEEILPLLLEDMLALLKASEVAVCCAASASCLMRKGGRAMLERLRKFYEEIEFNFRMEKAGGPLENVLEGNDHDQGPDPIVSWHFDGKIACALILQHDPEEEARAFVESMAREDRERGSSSMSDDSDTSLSTSQESSAEGQVPPGVGCHIAWLGGSRDATEEHASAEGTSASGAAAEAPPAGAPVGARAVEVDADVASLRITHQRAVRRYLEGKEEADGSEIEEDEGEVALLAVTALLQAASALACRDFDDVVVDQRGEAAQDRGRGRGVSAAQLHETSAM